MPSPKPLFISLSLSALLVVFGTLGYMTIEGWDTLDALYMTVITIATVGYGEVHKVSPFGRIYTMILIFCGVSTFLYVTGAVIQFMVEGRMRILLGRRKLDRKLAKLRHHYIVCGYGRIGKVICQRLHRENFSMVVIDNNPDLKEVLDSQGFTYIIGDASEETVLKKAGIHAARGLIAALATDTDNVFLVLSARQLAPSLNIIARAGHEAAKRKLAAAGANTVEAPYEMGAATMAQRIVRPTVTNFLELTFSNHATSFQMEEIPVAPGSRLENVMLKDSGIRQKYNLIIIAIKKADEQMIFNPSFETRITKGDTVIAVGEPVNLKKLEAELNPGGIRTEAPAIHSPA